MPGSPTTQGRPGTRNNAPVRVAFRCRKSVSTLKDINFAAQWLACPHPCQRFAPHLTIRHGRVALGRYLPRAPTDPDLRN
jgi:hypothetical protein